MCEVSECSVDLIITSPPYFNIKDYAKNGFWVESMIIMPTLKHF